jgi:thiamine pyrophosphate-dependent acetolactate synthase large subunit-like protein
MSSPRRCLTRADVVTELARLAATRRWPLVVGNGCLARQAMRIEQPGPDLVPLQGGMGLASAMAAGLAAAIGRPVIALEGDGNHLMGWAGAQLAGSLGHPMLHIVCWNGVYRSTGGQPLPTAMDHGAAAAAARLLGYAGGYSAQTLPELRTLLEKLSAPTGPQLVYLAEDPHTPMPERVDRPSRDYIVDLRFNKKLSDGPPTREQRGSHGNAAESGTGGSM